MFIELLPSRITPSCNETGQDMSTNLLQIAEILKKITSNRTTIDSFIRYR